MRSLLEALQIALPIIQAPMAGGGDTPELAAAVSEAGGLGNIGCSYLRPEQIVATASKLRQLTDKPFGVNLFAPMPDPGEVDPTAAITKISPYYAELGLPLPSGAQLPRYNFEEQFAAVLESGARVFSFTFGIPSTDVIAAAKAKGMLVFGTATHLEEALLLESRGMDAVVAQSCEAGGHRGTFLGEIEDGMLGAIALIPLLADRLRVPVIASGGIADGRGIAAALILGASAVQLGTVFLMADEAGTSEAYKGAIAAASAHETRITRAFSGRHARGIRNRMLDAYEEGDEAILPFPLQNALTRPLRTEAAKQGRPEFLSLWAGQGLGLAKRRPAGEIVRLLEDEYKAALRMGSPG